MQVQSRAVQSPAEEQVGRRPDGNCVPVTRWGCPPRSLVATLLPGFQPAPHLVPPNWQPPDPWPLSAAFVSRQEGSEVVKRLRRYVDQGLG